MKLEKTYLAEGLAVALGLIGMLVPAGCQPKSSGAQKPVAVSTIFAYYDALRFIGGDDIEAVILLPPHQSPHGYEPTIQDRAAVSKGALLIKNGLSIDVWADKLISANPSIRVLDISKALASKGLAPVKTEEVSITPQSEQSASEGEDVSAGNPHIWLDPRVQMLAAEVIRDALVQIDPPHAADYKARAAKYLDELKKLDEDFAAAAAQFKQREFIGFHSAYDYLARRYGLKQVASVEELPGEGPSLAQQAQIIRLIQEKHIKVIFLENAFPAQAADKILRETGAKTGILQPLETYDSPDQTYVSLMRENLKSLERALN